MRYRSICAAVGAVAMCSTSSTFAADMTFGVPTGEAGAIPGTPAIGDVFRYSDVFGDSTTDILFGVGPWGGSATLGDVGGATGAGFDDLIAHATTGSGEFVQFEITFVTAGTSTPTAVTGAMFFYDIDSDPGVDFTDVIGIELADLGGGANFSLLNPTGELVIDDTHWAGYRSARLAGNPGDFAIAPNIDTNDTLGQVNYTAVLDLVGVTSFTARFGVFGGITGQRTGRGFLMDGNGSSVPAPGGIIIAGVFAAALSTRRRR